MATLLSLALVPVASGCSSTGGGLPPLAPGMYGTGTSGIAVDSTASAIPSRASVAPPSAMRLGPNDQIEVIVLEADELNRLVRVDGSGRISLPLVGTFVAAGLTSRELEVMIQDSLRTRFIRDPHVSVQVTEMHSQSVSVVGAVSKPGVFQIGEPIPVLELIAMAGGLTDGAGATLVVERGGGGGTGSSAATTITISISALLESGDPRHNVAVNPGDLVKVAPAGVVYVVGEVQRPGAFQLNSGRGLTVLQAIALGEGLGANASGGKTVIIRTSPRGERSEVPVDVGDIIAGRAADVPLQALDVVFVPSNRAKQVTLGVLDALVRTVTLRGVF